MAETKQFGVGFDPATLPLTGSETVSVVQGGVTVDCTVQDIADLGGGGGVTDGDKGDITVSASGATWTVDNDAITYAKLQNVTVTQRVLGRNTAGAGDVEEVTFSQLLDWVGSPANGDLLYRSGGAWTRLAAGTNGHVLTLAAGLPTWAAAGGGGLTNWTDAISTSAPNATVPAASLAATNAATNVDAVIVPKGTGAKQAHVANNLATGGNKRGNYAVDWQTDRSNASEVASASWSVIPGGQNNTASANYAYAMGQMCTASGTHAFAHGQNNTASGTHSVAIGSSCNATAANAVAIGASCTADGINSYATGSNAATRSLFGSVSHAVGTGKQRFQLLLQRQTTDATPTALTTTGTAATAANQFAVPGNRACNVEGRVTARDTSTGASKSWRFDALPKNIANVTTLEGAVTPTVLYAAAGAAAWTIAVTADDANDVMTVTATGAAATTIAWTCDLHSVET